MLVADDNVDFAESFASMLRGEGHEVEAVDDGSAAWAHLEVNRPQVAFLDVRMPGLNGLDRPASTSGPAKPAHFLALPTPDLGDHSAAGGALA